MEKIKSSYNEYFDFLIEKDSSKKTIASSVICTKDVSSMKAPGSIESILSLNTTDFSETAKKSLSILENHNGFNKQWLSFKWKLIAFLNIQDAFSLTIYDDHNYDIAFKQWYFYYESKYLLIEAMMCGLNGFSASIGLLLRLILEFSLLQNYSFRRIEKNKSYSTLEQYLNNKFNPNWSTIINGCLPSDSFSKPIRKRLKLHLDGLSRTAVHPYHPEFSPKHIGYSHIPEQTLEGLIFPYQLSIVLEPILWLYFVNFPMLLNPFDITKKFGFNYPVGVYVDKMSGEITKKSISKSDFALFKEYSHKTQEFKDLSEYYNSFPDLTREQIIQTWDSKSNGEFKSIMEGYAMQISKFRVISELLALDPRIEKNEEYIDKLSKNMSFSKWKKIYKKL